MENAIEKFDLENFDFDQVQEEVMKSIKKTNIMICGATGVGKSSLVNDIFAINLATVGQHGRPETVGIHRYSNPTYAFNLYDTEGYEIGKVDESINDRYYDDILSFIDKLKKDNPSNIVATHLA